MKLLKIAIIISIVLVVVFIAYSFAGSNKVLEVKVTTPQLGTMTSFISTTGKVISGQESEIVSSVSSRVVRILAGEGQFVSHGTLLIVLDNREALTKVNSDKAMLREAHAKVEQAQRNLKALQKVYEVGGTSLSSIQDAEVQCSINRAAERKAAEELRNSSLYLEHFKIVAPFSGLIVKKSVQNGDLGTPGTSLLTLADMSKAEIEVSVDESDAGSLRVGQEAEISCEALPNRTWTEKIVRIEHAVRKDGSANTLKAHVSFNKDMSVLRLGQQVDVKIKLAEKKDVYKVPFDAVIRKADKSYIAIIHKGKVHLEPAVTGLEDAGSMEILSPVRPNQEIILGEGKNLHEGQRVSATRVK